MNSFKYIIRFRLKLNTRLSDGITITPELKVYTMSPGRCSASWCSCCGPRGGSTSAGAQGQAGTSRFGEPGQQGLVGRC